MEHKYPILSENYIWYFRKLNNSASNAIDKVKIFKNKFLTVMLIKNIFSRKTKQKKISSLTSLEILL